jgi:hypothetical protein
MVAVRQPAFGEGRGHRQAFGHRRLARGRQDRQGVAHHMDGRASQSVLIDDFTGLDGKQRSEEATAAVECRHG